VTLVLAWFTVVTVKATRRPSGEIAGAATVVTRYQSAGAKARRARASCASAGDAIAVSRAAVAGSRSERVDMSGA
jgi:hypothetical protein